MNKCLIFSENYVNKTQVDSTYRNIGAIEVAGLFRSFGIDTTVVEWFHHWTDADLDEAIDLWFADSDKQYIGISTPFSLNIVFDIQHILEKAKQQYPNLQILIGGNRVHDARLDEFVDWTFLGRSIETVTAWLMDQDLHAYATPNPSVLSNTNVNFSIDVPVLPPITDGDCLNQYDVLGFEIGIGCRFNCSFCSYDLRGAKNPLFVDADSLAEFLQSAYDKYQVKNFYIADDTLNEADEKLEILASALDQLTYEPNIVCYLRADLLERRKQQYPLLERIKLKGITMGLETLTPAAAKVIKKSPDVASIETALRRIRDDTPMSFTSSGMIVGLTGDTHYDLHENIERIIRNKLLHSMYPQPLSIRLPQSDVYDDSYLSDFSKYPEKYGYELLDSQSSELMASFTCDQLGSDMMHWKNEWTDSNEAIKVSHDITEDFRQRKIPLVSAFEWLSLLTFGITTSPADVKLAGSEMAWRVLATKVKKHKQDYKTRKLKWLREYCNK